MRLLQAGEGVGILIDQHIQSRDAIYVDFFDRPAATTSAVAALALRTGAPSCRSSRCRWAKGATGWFTSTPSSRRRRGSEHAIHEFTQRCTDVLEMYVRRHPELWLWMHRRWRDGLADSVGMFPSASE